MDQPRPQGLLGVQNGGSKKALANSRSRVVEILIVSNFAAGFVVG